MQVNHGQIFSHCDFENSHNFQYRFTGNFTYFVEGKRLSILEYTRKRVDSQLARVQVHKNTMGKGKIPTVKCNSNLEHLIDSVICKWLNRDDFLLQYVQNYEVDIVVKSLTDKNYIHTIIKGNKSFHY